MLVYFYYKRASEEGARASASPSVKVHRGKLASPVFSCFPNVLSSILILIFRFVVYFNFKEQHLLSMRLDLYFFFSMRFRCFF